MRSLILKQLKKWSSFLLIIFLYLSVNVLFNFKFWEQLFLKELPYRIAIFGEWPIYEYVAELVRGNILSGRNPFSDVAEVLYPFGWNFSLEDVGPINGFYFLLIRPFFSIHQSFIVIVLLSIIISNISMYLLLRKLKISTKTSILMGLIFGYTPFLVSRLGHPTYLALYLFPLFFLCVLYMKEAKKPMQKCIYAIVLGLIISFSALTNLYYSLMIVLLCVFICVFLLIFDRQKLFLLLRRLFPWIIISCIVVLLLLSQWFFKVYEQITFGRVFAASSVDSSAYSAGFFSIFLPINTDPIYGKFVQFATSYIPFIKPSFENAIYPGALLLGAFFYFIFYKKKITQSIVKKVFPIFTVSILFWVLTLGPFLRILDQKLPVPLPYLLLHFMPLVSMARSPGRFIVPFVFLGVMMSAFIIDDILKNKLKMKVAQNLFFLNLLFIFFLDQSYTAVFPSPYWKVIPNKTYEYLQTHGKSVLLEVPFTVRDGLRFQGDYHSIWLPLGQLSHKQKIFSIYGGRIRDDVFEYYKRNPLLGYLSDLINNPNVVAPELGEKQIADITRSIDFFGIEHILLKKDETYSNSAHSLFTRIGFKTVMTDRVYTLLYKPLYEQDAYPFILHLNDQSSNLYLAEGWGAAEATGRWVIGKRARILFKAHKPNPVKVRFTAHTLLDDQKMVVYINRKKITDILLRKEPSIYTFAINSHLIQGLNRLVFKCAKTVKPSNLIPGERDSRDLSVFINELTFENATK